MGTSRAYPVFRTTDAAEAYRRAGRLCALLEQVEDKVWLFAELPTVRDVRRIAAIAPGPPFDYAGTRTGPTTGDHLWFDLDVTALDDAAPAGHLPLTFSEEVGRERVEDGILAALGEGMASVEWHGCRPDDPEADSDGHPKYDGVHVVFHGDEAQYGHWTEEHTVFVHVTKFGDPPRARKLAAHIGGEVLGEAQLGW
ncbi:hypothetical protein ADK41_02610 [Streptomyces caelestis]|uniref:Uncharacterized protein n=2 Tax=Streptomyces TaxID=1883 RepID=A0A0M9XB18_9ACTN|nr:MULTISPECIES: hypothetical protein [Streptomyces]KOT45444.1 hypothetical protein ADK41_02610 [Streptomyces caelestis]KOV35118.1 hypothetical protein ADK58_04075 [Streptomyces sp. XY152]